MLNNTIKVQENQSWAKKVHKPLDTSFYFKINVKIASMINRFEENIALKCLDQKRNTRRSFC